MSDTPKPRIALVGVEDISVKLLAKASQQAEFTSIAYTFAMLEGPLPQDPCALFCGPPPVDMPIAEVAQSMRMNHPDQSIYYITQDRLNFHRASLQKNGFTEAFLMPVDEALAREAIRRDVSHASSGQLKSFRSVRLVDVAPGVVLGFDLYIHMPANDKHIKFASATAPLSEARAQRLSAKNMNVGMVEESQMSSFFKFTANQLKKLGDESGISETKRRERKTAAVRDLLSGVFSASSNDDGIAQGRKIMTDCREIIKSFIVGEKPPGSSWFERLLNASDSNAGTYSHAANVATFAALFSIALEIGDPEEIALAGLLHDIGLSVVPSEVCMKNENERTPDEEKLFRAHPRHALSLIKERKIIVSERTMKIIGQHHERWDGLGYPAGLPPGRMLPESQVLALADRIDELTAPQNGRPRMTTPEAIAVLFKEAQVNPSATMVEFDLLKKLCALFTAEDAPKDATAA